MARYSKNIAEQICFLISTDSYTIAEICEKVNISERTYYDWKAKNAEFAELIKKAQSKFDELIVSEAKKSLVKMIRGYTVQEKKTVSVDTGKKDENGMPIVRVKEHSVTDKYYQPVPAAVIFALTNRDPKNWKNKQATEVTGKDGAPLITPISREMARKIIENL
jgi:hypothetical protein